MLSGTGPTSSSSHSDRFPRHASAQSLRGSSYHTSESDGYATLDSVVAPLPPPPPPPQPPSTARQHAFNAPRPSLVPLQEYHSGFSDEDFGSIPTSSNHRRQQSFPNLLPLALRSRTPSPTRKTPKTPKFTEEMPYTGDGRSSKTAESPNRGGLAGWLSGAAAANALGMSSNAEDRTPNSNSGQISRPESRQSNSDVTPTRLRKTQTVAVDPTTPRNSVSITASRFMSAISKFAQQPASPSLDDELYNLDVHMALFPPSSPSDRDAFSPAAFKNLQMHATGLLTRMQNAYRQRTMALRELEAERVARKDALEEAVTRATHLKMQLEGMAHKAAEQEKAMQQLMDELMSEKKARAEEKLARERAIIFSPPEGSMVSEDLGVDDDQRQLRRKWRKSGGTVKSDLSFDTDEESMENESVFSRSRSPTIPPSTVDGSIIDGPTSQPKSSGTTPKARNSQQMSTFQKIIKGISGDVDEIGVNGCRNCKGQDASAAWDTVSLLRDENKHLKQRVSQLEVAVEGALDLVNGIGL